MIWILNMIVSANLRRVSLGISANVSGLYDVAAFQQKAQYEVPKLNLK